MFLFLCYVLKYNITNRELLVSDGNGIMLLFKKLSFMSVALAGVMCLAACAETVFPDYDDSKEDDVVIGEGGRVVKGLPDEESGLRADVDNVSYEGDDSGEEGVVKKGKDEVKPVVLSAENENNVAPAAVVPVNVSEEKAEEPAGPSVSYRLDTFYFNNGSAVLDNNDRAKIKQIAKTVKAHNAFVIVYGYASSRTRNTDAATHKLANFKISSERAENVAAALRREGVPSEKIMVEALSDTVPAYQEIMPEGERLNRRAEVYIAY